MHESMKKRPPVCPFKMFIIFLKKREKHVPFQNLRKTKYQKSKCKMHKLSCSFHQRGLQTIACLNKGGSPVWVMESSLPKSWTKIEEIRKGQGKAWSWTNLQRSVGKISPGHAVCSSRKQANDVRDNLIPGPEPHTDVQQKLALQSTFLHERCVKEFSRE